MFESLRVKNFRSIIDSGEIKLSNLNVLVGPNNSGKSSILYAIMLVKMTLEDKNEKLALVTSTSELDLGSYLDLIRGHDAEGKLTLEFALNRPAATRFGGSSVVRGQKSKHYAKCEVEFRFEKSENKIELVSFTGSDLSHRNILSVRKTDTSEWHITGPSAKLLQHLKVDFTHFIPIMSPSGPRPKDETLASESFGWFMSSRVNENIIARLMGEVKYIAPIRERIPRYGVVGTMASSELGPSGQNLMRVLSNSEIVSKKRGTIIQELNHWLSKKFKLLNNVRLLDIDAAGTLKTLVADDPRGETNINLASMGCGISQLVPVVVQTILMPDSGCLLVEQPEIHLHPAAQADLADLFIENTKGKRQFIIETHSEHFVLRLRRRIAEGKIKPENVGIFFVEKQRGVTKITRLGLKPNGHFERWPEGFFEEGFKEALAIAEAGG